MNVNNSEPTERSSILAILPPLSSTDPRTTTLVKPDRRAVITVNIGANTATGALTILKATAATGATTAVISQAYGGAGTVGNNKVFRFNHDVAQDATAPYIGVTIGAAGTVVSSALVEGFDARYGKQTESTDVTIVT